MLADWSSIFLGFGVVFGGLALYALGVLWRLRAAEAANRSDRGSK